MSTLLRSAVASTALASRAAAPPARVRRRRRAPARASQYYLSADPASLDPALSTDVQSGEVVTLLFDNLVQFDADGAAAARPRHALGDRLRPARSTPSTSGPAPTFHDGRPIRAADVRASMLRALDPATQAGRQWPLLPDPGRARATRPARRGRSTGIAVPDDTTIVFTLAEPLNIFPKLLAMPVAAVVPTPTPARLRPGAGRERALAVRLLVARRRDRARPEHRLLGRAPPKADTLTRPDHPRGADPGRRVRDRQPERGRDSVRRDPALGDDAARTSCSAGRRSATSTSP